MVHNLTTPFTLSCAEKLCAGDTVLLSGIIYTARDAAHGRMFDLLDKGESLPFDIKDSVIYYTGPSPARPNEIIGSAGPTTSVRMDAYSPRLLALGLRGMIGKGERNSAVIKAIQENKGVYFAAIGGAGALMASCVTKCELVCWEDLGSEAVYKLEVVNMPLTVIIDCKGENLYKLGPKAYLEFQNNNK